MERGENRKLVDTISDSSSESDKERWHHSCPFCNCDPFCTCGGNGGLGSTDEEENGAED